MQVPYEAKQVGKFNKVIFNEVPIESAEQLALVYSALDSVKNLKFKY